MSTLNVCHSCEGGICANSVIVAVRTDSRAVKTDISCLCSGNRAKLGRHKVNLGDAVLLVENGENVQLYGIRTVLAAVRTATREQVQHFAFNSLAQGLLCKLLTKMRKNVVNIENRIVIVFADANLDGLTALCADNAVDSKRNGSPLILLDTAVVVSLEESDSAILVNGAGFEIKTGGIDVGCENSDTLFKRLRTDGESVKALSAVVVIKLVACLYLVAESVGTEALCLEHCDRGIDCLALGL